MTEEPAVPGFYPHSQSIEAQLARILAATGCRSRAELARLLGLSRGRVYGLRQRTAIPDSWLLAFLRRYRLNPDWILQGGWPKFLINGPPASVIDEILGCFGTELLEKELRRRASCQD